MTIDRFDGDKFAIQYENLEGAAQPRSQISGLGWGQVLMLLAEARDLGKVSAPLGATSHCQIGGTLASAQNNGWTSIWTSVDTQKLNNWPTAGMSNGQFSAPRPVAPGGAGAQEDDPMRLLEEMALGKTLGLFPPQHGVSVRLECVKLLLASGFSPELVKEKAAHLSSWILKGA